jgi:hypothetical protein
MSYHVDFHAASVADALVIVRDPTRVSVPPVVRDHLVLALAALTEDTPVHVYATGHLCNNDYTTSMSELRVEPIRFTPASVVAA